MFRLCLLGAVLSFAVLGSLATESQQSSTEVQLDGSSEQQLQEEEDEDESQSAEASLSEFISGDYADYPVRVLKEVDVDTLNENCVNGECKGLMFDDPSEVVFFEAKPAIRFTSGSTYKFKKPQEYDVLKFIDSKFANFPLNLFYALKIRELDMRNCSIQSLTWDNFLMADQLSILLLSDNDLQEVAPMTFNSAENLAFLFLDGNDIETLHRESFKELNKLYMLDLHDNRISSLHDDVFTYLPALQQLNLAGNQLQVIADVLFANNPRLVSVSLERNALEKIGDYAFQNQEDMEYIGLSHNTPLQILVGNMRVDNLWARNCSISRVNIYGKVKNADFQLNRISELYFSRPESLETLRISDNSLMQIASLSQATNLQYFDVSNNPQLQTLPEFWQADSLEVLDLSNTSLTSIPIAILSASEKLKSLNVSNNHLSRIDPGDFKYFEKLDHLYLHRNNWNCYSLQIIMDMLIRPWKISYTMDIYDENFPGEYIGGIKCMYRLDDNDDDDMENSLLEPLSMAGLTSRLTQSIAEGEKDVGESSQVYEDGISEQVSDIEILRTELKAIVGIYEQKFSHFYNKIEELDRRLKTFEQFNKTLWQHVTITI
uniref:Uncharacterized protein n=1 Tax=Stomoxys calcitrans TaxID=35570 RepID=A0A1I8P6Q3_STOCA